MSASNSSCAVFARVHTASPNRYSHICAKTVQKHPTPETIPVSIAVLLYPGVDGRELLKISEKIIKNHMNVHFVSYTGNPVPTNTGMLIVPTNTPDTPVRKPDLLLVPGSLLQDAENVLQDQSLLLFLKKTGRKILTHLWSINRMSHPCRRRSSDWISRRPMQRRKQHFCCNGRYQQR
jgi:hypothetical protein